MADDQGRNGRGPVGDGPLQGPEQGPRPHEEVQGLAEAGSGDPADPPAHAHEEAPPEGFVVGPAARRDLGPISGKNGKTNSQNTAEWRHAFANALTYDEKHNLIRRIYEVALDGDMRAAALLLHQSLGKPAVTTAGKMADDAVSDQLERRIALLPKEEFETYLRITAKLQDPQESPPPPA